MVSSVNSKYIIIPLPASSDLLILSEFSDLFSIFPPHFVLLVVHSQVLHIFFLRLLDLFSLPYPLLSVLGYSYPSPLVSHNSLLSGLSTETSCISREWFVRFVYFGFKPFQMIDIQLPPLITALFECLILITS